MDNLYFSGARKATIAIRERIFAGGVKPKGDDWVYLDAEFTFISSSEHNIQLWLSGTEVMFRNHKYDSGGKLISCEAYFPDYE